MEAYRKIQAWAGKIEGLVEPGKRIIRKQVGERAAFPRLFISNVEFFAKKCYTVN